MFVAWVASLLVVLRTLSCARSCPGRCGNQATVVVICVLNCARAGLSSYCSRALVVPLCASGSADVVNWVAVCRVGLGGVEAFGWQP